MRCALQSLLDRLLGVLTDIGQVGITSVRKSIQIFEEGVRRACRLHPLLAHERARVQIIIPCIFLSRFVESLIVLPEAHGQLSPHLYVDRF